MAKSKHNDWKEFWDNQAKITDLHQAVRGDKIFSDNVQLFHDKNLVDLLQLDSKHRILDAGCGVGDQTLLISPLVSHITAIDFSPEMVRRCRERITASGIENADIQVANVTELPFKNNSFDRIVSIAVLQYLNPDEVDKMFTEMSRVLKPGGIVVYHVKDLFSPTGAMINLGRYLRAMIKGRPELEYYYRSRWWYKKKLRLYGKIEQTYNYGTWTPFMPRKLMAFIATTEKSMIARFGLLPFGKEYYMQVRNPKLEHLES